MLYVLLNWGYLFATAFLTGFAVLRPFRRLGYCCGKATGMLMAGLAALTVYAQVFSLFGGVGLWANVLLLLFCLLAIVLWHRQLLSFWKKKTAATGPAGLVLLACLILLMAYGTSRGYMHVDTGLYHAQAIRWIEEYGVVCGLGNLHSRFAYNSAAFALCALYSMKWLFGESLHTVQGFLALVVAVQCAGIFGIRRRSHLLVSDFVRLGAIYYLTVLFGEMVSPASDYFAMLLLFYVLIAWLDLMERKEGNVTPYALLSLLLVFAVTVKVSAAVVLLLVLKPAIMLIRDRKWKQIGLYLGLGLGICIPWLIRGVLISGWLLYPFTFLDLFQVDWKIEKGYADCDAKEIQVFARLLYDVNLYDTPFAVWVRGWFAALKGLEKVWVLSSALGVVAGAGTIVYTFLAGRSRGARKVDWDWVLYAFVLIVGYLFWQFSAPLVRYGYVYIVALPTGVGGFIYCHLFGRGRKEIGRRLFLIAAAIFALYKAADLTGAISRTAAEPYYIRQQDYGTFEAFTYEVDGVTVYVPADGGQIGYDLFPSSPRVQEIELRGKGKETGDLRYGFRAAGSENTP